MKQNKQLTKLKAICVNKICLSCCLVLLGSNMLLAYKFAEKKAGTIVTIDIEKIVGRMIEEASDEGQSESDIKANVSKEIQYVDELLAEKAKSGNYIIVPSKAVLAGADDITDSIIKEMGVK
jgi:hypothetical protein